MKNPESLTFHSTPWINLGAPPPGTVTALAVSQQPGDTLFAGTRTGLYRNHSPTQDVPWQRLPNAPLEILVLGLSPNFANDHTLFAGTGTGLFVSHDGGEQWLAPSTPLPNPVILCLALSPNYVADGIVVAGTLEEGVYFSDNRGTSWAARTVGLLDAAVYSLAFSPNFAQDETLFAGTESALYYSYNGARAWKMLDFPEEATPILALALSPNFAQDRTVFAGTEQQGLYRSTDLGNTWQQLTLPATAVNSLLISPQDASLLAATNDGLYCSKDGGQTWYCLLDQPDAFSLAANEMMIVSGVVNQGAWRTLDQTTWQPIFNLPERPLTGMVLSPDFVSDGIGFLYGVQEGIWWTDDGGKTWYCLNETLPTTDVFSMALSPHFRQDQLVLAASTAGLLVSEDAGDHWTTWLAAPISHVHISPSGTFIVTAASNGELWIANGRQGDRLPVTCPWSKQVQLLAIAVDDSGQIYAATWERTQELLTLWQGESGHFVQRLSQLADSSSLVSFWMPSPASEVKCWYASLDQHVWKFANEPGAGNANADLSFTTEDGSKILSLVGSADGSKLFALTGQWLYQVTEANISKVVHDFGDERAVALTLSPDSEGEITAFALLLGGQFYTGKLEEFGM
ncbi:MAG: hypothetical protein U0175_38430 [Caldilineaceae bacterium]